jgi:hypothetical protein
MNWVDNPKIICPSCGWELKLKGWNSLWWTWFLVFMRPFGWILIAISRLIRKVYKCDICKNSRSTRFINKRLNSGINTQDFEEQFKKIHEIQVNKQDLWNVVEINWDRLELGLELKVWDEFEVSGDNNVCRIYKIKKIV